MNFSGSMSWFDWACLVLAFSAVLDAWFNGGVLSPVRSRVEARAELYDGGTKRYWWAKLLSCPFCLGHHVPWVLAVAFYVPSLAFPAHAQLWKMPLYCLSVTRAGWLLNGILPADLRYERAAMAAPVGHDVDKPLSPPRLVGDGPEPFAHRYE